MNSIAVAAIDLLQAKPIGKIAPDHIHVGAGVDQSMEAIFQLERGIVEVGPHNLGDVDPYPRSNGKYGFRSREMIITW
jgi:hypothetical protein